MQTLKDIFFMPLFPHLYAIPLSIVLGMAIGYVVRGKLDIADQQQVFPRKPQVD